MLTMTGLTKTYRTDSVETTALDAIDLDIADGEFVAIMGPSGCGKSTLLNVMGMLDSPTGGSYVFDSKEVAGLGEHQLADTRKANIGFIYRLYGADNGIKFKVLTHFRFPSYAGSIYQSKLFIKKIIVGMNGIPGCSGDFTNNGSLLPC